MDGNNTGSSGNTGGGGSSTGGGGNTGGGGSIPLDWCEHNRPPGGCFECAGGITCQHGNNIETCSQCNPIIDGGEMDEVIVSSKDYCKGCENRLEQCICECDGCGRLKRFCNCHITPPDIEKDEEEDEGKENTNVGGSDKNQGNNDNNNQPYEETTNATNFERRIITPAFKANIKSGLGINLDSISINVNSSLPHGATSNASYQAESNTLHIYPEIFTRGYTDADYESIVYHELIHAKQHFDGRLKIERDEYGESIKQAYKVPITQKDIDDVNESIRTSVEIQAKDLKNDADRDTLYQTYKRMLLDPLMKDRNEGKEQTKEYNKVEIEMEVEAYKKQLEKYGSKMSAKCLDDIQKMHDKFQDILNVINNQ